MSETIFAPATGRGPSALCVVRISGPGAWEAVARLTDAPLPAPRRMALRVLRDHDILDEALVVLFEAGASATGERVAELHLHGSPAVQDAVLRALGGFEGVRLAEPGEFSRRALEAGRLDLSQIEGLADLLAAETEAQRLAALRVMRGWLSGLVERWRSDLIEARALLEVMIDFSDEDVPEDTTAAVSALVEGVLFEVRAQLDGSRVAERLREGFEVAVVGPPNAGKSTLLNRIARRDVAIVSPVPGTTRDVLEVRVDLGGLPVTFLDTAGLRESEDVVERIGVERARARAEAADLRVILVPEGEVPVVAGIGDDLRLAAKADLWDPAGPGVSGLTGAGVEAMLAQVEAVLRGRVAGASAVAHARQRMAMERAAASLAGAMAALERDAPVEIVAELLREATDALEALVGRVDAETILDDIFSRFCLGK